MSKQVNVSSIESFFNDNEASKCWLFSKDAVKVEQLDSGAQHFSNQFLQRTDAGMVIFARPLEGDRTKMNEKTEGRSTGLVTYGDKHLNYIDRTGQEFMITAEEGHDLVVVLGLNVAKISEDDTDADYFDDEDYLDEEDVGMPYIENIWFWGLRHNDTASEMARNNPEAFRQLVAQRLSLLAFADDQDFQVYLVDAGLRSRLLRPSYNVPISWLRHDYREYVAPINGAFPKTKWGRRALSDAKYPTSPENIFYQCYKVGSGLYSHLSQS